MDGEPEAYKDESLRSISISPRERLERIEKVLERIDLKLDSKADASKVEAMDVRVKHIENVLTHFQEVERNVEAEHDEIKSDFKSLKQDHLDLKNRIAYMFGAIAVAAVLAEYLLAHAFG